MVQNKDNRMTDDRRNSSTWEKHFSTIATTLILAAMMFTGGTLYAFGNKLTEVVITANYTSKQLQELSDQMKLERAELVNRNDFVELRERVRALERKSLTGRRE